MSAKNPLKISIFLKLQISLIICNIFLCLPTYANNLSSGIDALNNNNPSIALKYFTDAVKEDSTNPFKLYYLGLALKDVGENERAKKVFNKVLSLNPDEKIKTHIKSILNPKIKASYSSKSFQISNVSKQSISDNYLDQAIKKEVFRWDVSKMPLMVYFDGGRNISGYSKEYQKAVKDAFKKWQSVMDNKIRFVFIDNQEKANIKVQWIEAFQGHVIGQNPFLSINNVVVKSDIKLSTSLPNGKYTSPQTMYSVALHEIGHALGIQGHSPEKNDVMYYSINEKNVVGQLSYRDINTMKLLYKQKAETTNNVPLDMANTKKYYKVMLYAEKESKLGNYQKAIDYYNKAINMYNKDYKAYYASGVAYLKLNDNKNAISSLQKALSLEKNDCFIYYNLAVAHIRYANNSLDKKTSENYSVAYKYLELIKDRKDKPKNTDNLLNQLKILLKIK